MTTKIFEELPSRDNRPASAGAERPGPTNMKEKMEKKVRQAVYDIRYRARREGVDIKQAYSQYMQNSSLNGQERNMVKAKIFGTGIKEDYNIEQFASSSVAKALFKVFVEGVEEEESTLDLQELKKGYVKSEIGKVDSQAGVGRYKVRVTDKNGTSYVRYATREKISDLRANPNIESVEMTGYGEPYEGERTKGDRTAAAKAGKDYDGDGNVESGAKEHAGAVHNAIQRKKGGVADGKDTSSVKEDVNFFEEEKKNKKKDKKFDVMRGKNDCVKLFPETSKVNEEVVSETSYSKFLNMIQEKTLTAAETAKKEEIAKSLKSKYGKTPKTYAIATSVAKRVAEETACDSSAPQRDARGDYAKTNLVKNKLRSALGVKNPIVMVSNEEDVKEGAGLSVGISKLAGQLNANPRTSAEQGAKNFQKNVADPIGKAVKGAARAVLQPANMSPEAQKARKDKYRPEEVQLEGEMVDEGTKEAQERRFQKHGDRTESETHMRLIGTATTSQDRIRERQRRVKPESPLGEKLKKRSESMGKKISKLQKARSSDTSSFRQGPTDKSIKKG
jgi:hypothetical protein